MLWRLRKCFCGFSLRSSCIATAITLIFFCCAALISEISVLATDSRLTDNEKIAGYVVIAVVTLLMLPSSILLLYGVIKNLQRPVLVWFAVTVALFVPQTVGMFLNIDEGFIVYMLTCCALAVELYMMALVYSYMVEQSELKRRASREAAAPVISAAASTCSATVQEAGGTAPGPSRRFTQVVELAAAQHPGPQLATLKEEEVAGASAAALHTST